MEEIKKVIDFRKEALGPTGGEVLAVCLSARRNMCIHSRVLEVGDRESVDSLCRDMTASWVRERAAEGTGGEVELCDYYENYSRDGLHAGM
jgi:DNA excision repair protein ERCC-2